MEDFFKSIANYGFPIVVASYLLLRMEKVLGSLKDEITSLKDKIDNLIDKIK